MVKFLRKVTGIITIRDPKTLKLTSNMVKQKKNFNNNDLLYTGRRVFKTAIQG